MFTPSGDTTPHRNTTSKAALGHPVARHALTDRESGNLKDLAEFLKGANVDAYTDFATFRAHAVTGWEGLDEATRQKITQFASGSTSNIALVLGNLPADRALGPTPKANSDSLDRSLGWGETLLTAISVGLGRPISYGAERRGRIFQDIFPTSVNAKALSSQSSIGDLGFHVEMAFHPTPPDLLMLNCLRPDKAARAGTLVASMDDIVGSLDDRDVAALSSAGYALDLHKLHSPYTYKGAPLSSTAPRPITPLLPGGTFRSFRFEPELMTSLTLEHASALHKAEEAATDVSEAVYLTEGEVLVLDNRRAVHARTPFEAAYDGTDRWLLRCMISQQPVSTDGVGFVEHAETELVQQWARLGAAFETIGAIA